MIIQDDVQIGESLVNELQVGWESCCCCNETADKPHYSHICVAVITKLTTLHMSSIYMYPFDSKLLGVTMFRSDGEGGPVCDSAAKHEQGSDGKEAYGHPGNYTQASGAPPLSSSMRQQAVETDLPNQWPFGCESDLVTRG
eukprot:scaffold29648_cov19-Prasinocladus_malaysianus.AAC.1